MTVASAEVEEPRGSVAARAPGHARRLTSPVLVDRDEELRLLTEAACSPPAVAVVEGEAGLGKTRLIDELLGHPDVADRRVLVGQCHCIREPFPLGPVIEAVHTLAGDLPQLAFTRLAGALRPLLPELSDDLPPAPEPLADAAAERHRVFRALAEVLGAAGPAVMVLEDLHWADEHTLEFLSFVTATQPGGLALVLSYRPWEGPAGLGAVAARLPPATTGARIELHALDERATAEMAAAILETEPISGDVAAYLCERTGGVPFAVEEVLALLQECQDVVRQGDGWERQALEELGVPRAIRDSVLERVGRFTPGARAAVEAAAVLQVPASEPVVRAVSGLEESGAPRALSEAIATGLLEERRSRIGFRHVLAAQAVREALPAPRRRELHDRAASALAALEPSPLGQLAHHLKGAGRIEECARVAEQAADQASGLGDDQAAAVLLREVVTDANLDPPARARVALKLAQAALRGLTHEQVLPVLQEVLEHGDLPEGERGELRVMVALLLDLAGQEVDCYRQLETAVAELEDRPASRIRAMAALAVPNIPDVEVEEHLSWIQRAVDQLDEISDPVLHTAVLANRAQVMTTIGDQEWEDSLGAIPTEVSSLDHQRELGRAIHAVANTSCYTGHYDTAEAFLERGLALTQDGEDRQRELSLMAVRIAMDYNLGRWSGLDESVDALLADLAEAPRFRDDIEWVGASLALTRGDLDAAQVRLEDALRLAERNAAVQVLALPAAGLARLHLARGNADTAVSAAMRAVSAYQPKGLWAPAGPAVRWAVEALVAVGERRDAEALLERFRAGLRDRDAPVAAAAAEVAEGILAEAAGRPEEAAWSFLAGAAAYAGLGCRYEAAQANERAGLCLLATEDDTAAETLLAALDVFDDLGADWDAARCARAARSHGLSLPTPYRGGRRGYGDELSPREEEVALLAADGLTNKEIAAELFLSPNTVKMHISNALQKLDVDSRRELGPLLDR